MHANDDLHRGNVYNGFSTSRKIDVVRVTLAHTVHTSSYVHAHPVHSLARALCVVQASGAPFDGEMRPRISAISPKKGSTAGGTDITISGVGFGSSMANLQVTVGDHACALTSLSSTDLTCRVQALPAEQQTGLVETTPPLSAFPLLASHRSERGARFQWESNGELLMPSFSAPSYWDELASADSPMLLEGWFEAPVSATIYLTLPLDALATLYWSGNASAIVTETLAEVDSVLPLPVLVELWSSKVEWDCVMNQGASPCSAELATMPAADATYRVSSVDASTASPLDGQSIETYFAGRWSGTFQATASGDTTFTLVDVDDDATLLIDGTPVVHATCCSTSYSGAITLQDQQWYTFEVYFHQGGGPWELRLDWHPPGDAAASLFTPQPRVWPRWPRPPTSGLDAVSRALAVVEGERYWLAVECKAGGASCKLQRLT